MLILPFSLLLLFIYYSFLLCILCINFILTSSSGRSDLCNNISDKGCLWESSNWALVSWQIWKDLFVSWWNCLDGMPLLFSLTQNLSSRSNPARYSDRHTKNIERTSIQEISLPIAFERADCLQEKKEWHFSSVTIRSLDFVSI